MAGQIEQDDEGINGINVTPLVDITLVLLIIFMVTASYIVKETIEIELPRAAHGGETVQKTFALLVTKDGKTYLNGAPVDESGLVTAVQQLKAARAPKAPLPPPTPTPLPQTTQAPPPPTRETAQNTPAPVIITGITLESTSQGGSFAVGVGNTLRGTPEKTARAPEEVKPYKAEKYAAAAQVTELPRPLNRESVNLRKYYPQQALRSGFEGDVVLRLLID